MGDFMDIFSLIVAPEMPDGVMTFVDFGPKVELTIIEGKRVTRLIRNDWPEGMSPASPIATVADTMDPKQVVYILGKVVNGVTIEAAITGLRP